MEHVHDQKKDAAPQPQRESGTGRSFFQSGIFRGVLYGVGGMVILLLVFQAGVFVGFKKAMFSSQWAKNYSESFFPRPEMAPPFMIKIRPGEPRGFMNSHGAFGEIIKIEGSVIAVKGQDEVEKNILISDGTVIEKDFEKLGIADLQMGDEVIIFGSPNDAGQIEAKLVRILPEHVISFILNS